MNSVDERIWAYIDGIGTDDERRAIEHLIATDQAFAKKYEEIMAFNNELMIVEPDEPSMAFTYNVMEAVRAEHAKNPLKAGINKNIIRGITIFFILTIAAIVLYTFASVPWGNGTKVSFEFKVPDIKSYINPSIVKGFFFFDTVLGLFLFDSWLRRRNVVKQA